MPNATISSLRPLGNVIVTGAASGLGAAAATAILAAGGTPIALDVAPIDTAAYESRRVDLTNSEATERTVREVGARGIDGVVTAAGIDVPGELGAIPGPDWERIVQVNLFGTAAVIRAALPSLLERQGRIVTIASTLGHRAVSDATAYCASKFGVIGFTRALTAELKGRVGVTLLTPGGMHTSFFDAREERYRPPPGADLCDPAAVANAIVFSLSQPVGCEVKELVIAHPNESSWP